MFHIFYVTNSEAFQVKNDLYQFFSIQYLTTAHPSQGSNSDLHPAPTPFESE